MSYHQQGAPEGRRQGPPYPIMGANGGAANRAPAAGVYGMPQYGQQADGYGGPPPSPVVPGSWERGYAGIEEPYIRPEQGILPGTGTLGSGASGSGDASYMVTGSNPSAMAGPLPSYYPPSLYGVPPSVYPFQQPTGFPGPYPAGGGGGGAGAAGSGGAGAGSTSGGNFYAQSGYARSTNPGQPIQTTTNLQGPDGCNLFVFHIPNTMTNEALFRLFSKFGTVISARIMVEKATGRSRGFGFVSYDNRDSAEKAISQMNGYQIEHKRLKVQHKKDKERDRFVPAPSPTQQRMMPGGPAAGPAGVASRVQQPPTHFRQPLLSQHNPGLRHHSVGEDKPPPPSPAAETGAGSVSQGFAISPAEEDLPEHGEASTSEVGIDGSVDPTFGASTSRPSAGEKFVPCDDHPHMAYIYRGRVPTTRDEEAVAGGYPSAGGGDGKTNVGEKESPEQGADGSAYRGRDDGTNYLTHTGPAPPASVGGSSRPRPASPDPKTGVSRPRSASPNAAAASAAAVVAAAVSLPHQTLEHAMQTKLTLGSAASPPASAQPS